MNTRNDTYTESTEDDVTVSGLGPCTGHSSRYGRTPDDGGSVVWLALLVLFWVVSYS